MDVKGPRGTRLSGRLVRGLATYLALGILVGGVGLAQPYTLDSTLETLEIKLHERSDAPGVRWAGADGRLGEETLYVFAKGLSNASASSVFLVAPRLGDQLQLTLAKDTWGQSLRSCTTDESGHCQVDFRTWGDVGFKIDGSAGTPWVLVLLTSPELPLDSVTESPLFAADRKDAARYEANAGAGDSSGGGGLGLLTAVGALLTVAIGVLAVVIYKRRPSAAASVALLVFVSLGAAGTLLAQNERPGSDDAGEGYEHTVWDRSEEDYLDDRLEELAEERDDERRNREAQKRAEETYKKIKGHVETLMKLKKLASNWADLSTCSRLANSPGMPRVPSFCADDPACQSCYSAARSEFDRVRSVFEQLRTIYKCTKDFTDSAISFGDSASGVHGVSGLAWQSERLKIEQSVDRLEEAYDGKYDQLTSDLHSAMIELSICEARFGEPDWYDRFGYMYFEFVRDKYKRTD